MAPGAYPLPPPAFRLLDLPLEIFLETINILDRKTWRNLRLASQLTKLLIDPKLYNTLHVTCTDESVQKAVKIAKHRTLKKHVRALNYYADVEDWWKFTHSISMDHPRDKITYQVVPRKPLATWIPPLNLQPTPFLDIKKIVFRRLQWGSLCAISKSQDCDDFPDQFANMWRIYKSCRNLKEVTICDWTLSVEEPEWMLPKRLLGWVRRVLGL